MPLRFESSPFLTRRTAALAILVVAYAVFAATLEPHTWPSAIAVLVPAAVIGIAALRTSRPRDAAESEATHRGIRIWSLLFLIGLLWEAWAFFHQPAWDVASYDHPTLSTLINPAFEHTAVRAAAWLAWLYAGLRLARP